VRTDETGRGGLRAALKPIPKLYSNGSDIERAPFMTLKDTQ